ncbi:YolD-like family protein [Peribacillus sp. NPDC006672]
MTIRDRGNIKWTNLMLPEHIKMLRNYFDEDYYDEPEPVLDEQYLEEMNV